MSHNACTVISLDELDAYENSPENQIDDNLFEQIDENKDGNITKEEALDYFKKQDPNNVPDLDSLWSNEDKDGDGVIS